jgi:hypothetical protein
MGMSCSGILSLWVNPESEIMSSSGKSFIKFSTAAEIFRDSGISIPGIEIKPTQPCTNRSQYKSNSTEEPKFAVTGISYCSTIKENIQVHVEGDTVVVCAMATEEDQADDEQYQYIGRPLHSLGGRYSIPNDVDHENVKAKLENGLLSLIFSKKSNSTLKRRKIPVE